MDNIKGSTTTSQQHDALLSLLAPYLNGDRGTRLRQTVLEIPTSRLDALSVRDWAHLSNDEPLSARGSEALHRLLAQVLSGDPRAHDPDHDAAIERDVDPARLFAYIFVSVAALVPAPAPLVDATARQGLPLVSGGEKGLVALCKTLPQVSRKESESLLSTPLLQAVYVEDRALAKALARVGLTPVEFRDASRAVAATIIQTLVASPVKGSRVVLGVDGQFVEGWPGSPLDALTEVASAIEQTQDVAHAVLVWLVAAAEVAPEASLFPMLRTAGTLGGVAFTLASGVQSDSDDDPNTLWAHFIQAVAQRKRLSVPDDRDGGGAMLEHAETEPAGYDMMLSAANSETHAFPNALNSRSRPRRT